MVRLPRLTPVWMSRTSPTAMRLTPSVWQNVHDLARRLVENVALLAIQPRADLRLAFREALGPPRARLAAAQLLLKEAVDLVPPLLARA